MKATRASLLLHSLGVAASMAMAATARLVNAGAEQLLPSRTVSPPTLGGYRNRSGSSNAKVKRAALKRRNVLRNRRAHRG